MQKNYGRTKRNGENGRDRVNLYVGFLVFLEVIEREALEKYQCTKNF